MHRAQQTRVTVGEYARMIECGALGPDDAVELLHGHVVAREPQDPPHASAVSRAGEALRSAVGSRAIVRVQLPFVAGEDSMPEPDVAVVPPRPDWYATNHPDVAWVVVESARASLAADRMTKRGVYAAAGVPQYLIANLRDGHVEEHLDPDPATGGYRVVCVRRRGERIALVALPDATVAVDDLLAPR